MVVHIPRWLNVTFTFFVFFGALHVLMSVLSEGAASAYVPLGNPLAEQYADVTRARLAFVIASALLAAVSGMSLIRLMVGRFRTP